jgi:hypothetical protein
LPNSEESYEENVKGQPEMVLVIQDVDSIEEENAPNETVKQNKEVSTEEIQRYIDEIDQAYKGKIVPHSEVQDKVVDPALGLHKYVIKDKDSKAAPSRPRREAVKADKPLTAPQQPSNKIPAVDGEKISNERKTSGGLSYNVGFEPAKASKPQLSSRTKREGARPVAITDMEKPDEMPELPKVTISKDHRPWFKAASSLSTEDSSSSESAEVIHPDPQLPKLDLPTDEDGTFSEVLHKAMKSHQQAAEQQDNNSSNVYTQEVNRLPHHGPTIKNPNPFLAVDPPAR